MTQPQLDLKPTCSVGQSGLELAATLLPLLLSTGNTGPNWCVAETQVMCW